MSSPSCEVSHGSSVCNTQVMLTSEMLLASNWPMSKVSVSAGLCSLSLVNGIVTVMVSVSCARRAHCVLSMPAVINAVAYLDGNIQPSAATKILWVSEQASD